MTQKRTNQALEQRVKQLEKEVLECKHQTEAMNIYEKAVKSSEDIIAAVDRNYRYLIANEAFLTYHSMNREQVIGHSVAEVLGKDLFHSVIKKNVDRCLKGESVRFEMSLKYPKIGEQHMDISYYPLKTDGEAVEGVVASIRNITERKEAERELQGLRAQQQAIMDSFPGVVDVLDRELNIIWTNKTANELAGGNPAGRKCYRVYRGREKPSKSCQVLETFRTGKPIRREQQLILEDGGANYFDIQTTIVKRDKQGNPTQVLEAGTDITERKRAEKALEAQLGLEQVVATVSRSFINLAPNEIDDGINRALETIGVFSGVDRSYVFLFYDNGTKMNNTHEWCAEGVEPQIDNLQGLSADIVRWWMNKLNRFETIHIPCVADLPPEASTEKDILQAQDIQSLIVVPIVHGNSLVGFIGFDSVRAEKAWSEESIVLLGIIAEILANAFERKRVGEALEKSNEELKAQTQSLEQLNAALGVLLERREKDKEELEEKVVSNVKELVLPYLESLRKTRLDSRQVTCVNIVESNLKEIVSPFLRRLASKYFRLTAKEIQIAGLIKQGMTTKEIAEWFSVSTNAIQFHRHNIRAKLGLKNQQVNLGTYLSSLS